MALQLKSTAPAMKQFAAFLLVTLLCHSVYADGDSDFVPQEEGGLWGGHSEFINPPVDGTKESRESWVQDIVNWRAERRQRVGMAPLGTGGDLYDDLSWVQSSYVQTQMMVHDQFFFDHTTNEYTVDRYLDDLEERFGGLDSVLLWQAYPNVGVDDRNAIDLFHDMPGGREGIRKMVKQFQSRNVRVLMPVYLWDVGTHDDGLSKWDSVARTVNEFGMDGVNGDTLEGFPWAAMESFRKLNRTALLEPELGPDDEKLIWNVATWGYWQYVDKEQPPLLSRYKWLEPRHMVHICNRWERDHTDDLQQVLFNGVGFVAWENIFGWQNQMTPRDAEVLKRIMAIFRTPMFSKLLSKDWSPFEVTLQSGVYASRFGCSAGGCSIGPSLISFVNRNEFAVDGDQMIVEDETATYYDLWTGRKIDQVHSAKGTHLSFHIDGNGFGAVAVIHGDPDQELQDLLKFMESRKPLNEYSNKWTSAQQTRVKQAATYRSRAVPEGMARIPKGTFYFRVSGTVIEGDNRPGVDVQYPWEREARRSHAKTMQMESFYMDKHPVTNKQFSSFLADSKYTPTDSHNFLRHWNNGTYPAGWENKPVVWVSLEDARAYARWAGKRLPTEEEWQYAAQGASDRMYPWGNTWDPSRVPAVCTERKMCPMDDVGSHPTGKSPFGVEDLVATVWQYTDEYTEEHNRFVITRGGNSYQPQGAKWYYPQAYELDRHSKYLLMAPSLDRSGGIGFRCAADAAPGIAQIL